MVKKLRWSGNKAQVVNIDCELHKLRYLASTENMKKKESGKRLPAAAAQYGNGARAELRRHYLSRQSSKLELVGMQQ